MRILLACACLVAGVPFAQAERRAKLSLELSSPAFASDGVVPARFSCDGAGESPPLAWRPAPVGTKSIAVMVTDPEATHGTFTHWLLVDLPPQTTSLPAGASLPSGALAAPNDAGTTGYTPPCPPDGTHHYYFQVFALDIRLPHARTLSRSAFLAAIDGHVLASGKLVATYTRSGAR